MTDRYAELRAALEKMNLFCSPDAVVKYRAATSHQAIAALLAERDALREALQGVLRWRIEQPMNLMPPAQHFNRESSNE